MRRYVLQRLTQFLIVFFIVTFGVMVFLRLGLDAPDDPARTMLGGYPDQALIDATNEKYHLQSNYLVQYFYWLKGLVIDQDLGYSVSNTSAVSSLIAARIGVTLLLGFYVIGVALLIAVPLAVSQAYWRDRGFDKVSGFVSFVFVAVPAIVTAVFLKLLFVETWHVFPRIADKVWPWQDPIEHVKNFALPVLTLALPTGAVFSRLLRSEMSMTLQSDFIALARAKGLSPRRILWRHALRNSLLTLVTSVGVQMGVVLGGAIIAETFFDLKGMGHLLIRAVLGYDLFTVQAITAILVIAVVLVNLLVDVLYSVIDPRVRLASALR